MGAAGGGRWEPGWASATSCPDGLLGKGQWLFGAIDWLHRTNLAQGSREFVSPSSKLLARRVFWEPSRALGIRSESGPCTVP